MVRIGKYELRGELGHGAMGTVYKAWDSLLERFVAIKLIGESLTLDERRKLLFEREAKAIARMSHPNIVTIHDFNYIEQQPYIAMEWLNGCDLGDLAPNGKLTLVQKLGIILQVCSGLTHAHQQEVIHRDIKPTNIFITESGNVKIMDFGIARLAAGATMTQGTLMGTPEYMSPEQILGEKLDERSDIFAVGTLLYWLVQGENPFAAENVQSAFYKILNSPAPRLNLPQLAPEQLIRLQSIVDRSLAKKVEDRYSNALKMAADIRSLITLLTKDQLTADSLEPDWAQIVSQQRPKTSPKIEPPHSETRIERTVRLGSNPASRPSSLPLPPTSQPRMKYLLLGIVGLFAIGLSYVRYFGNHSHSSAHTMLAPNQVRFGLAYESAKQKWLEPLVQKFETLPEGQNVKIDLMPLASVKAERAILSGDRRISVWCPASDVMEDMLIFDWKSKYGKSPILESHELAYSPMVFVMWEEHYQAFLRKYQKVRFSTLMNALEEKNGWASLAQKPEWGLFGFGCTNPKESNSGLMMLLLLAHEYHRKPNGLTMADIQDAKFQSYLQRFQSKTTLLGDTPAELMKQMLVKGPATIDAVFVYENVAVDYLKDAEGRWGKLHFIYPEYNIWNQNPYCILDTSWVNKQQKAAAKTFMEYLLNEPAQRKALDHGFRPIDTKIPFLIDGSPFLKYRDSGLQVDIGGTCEESNINVLRALQESWKARSEKGSI